MDTLATSSWLKERCPHSVVVSTYIHMYVKLGQEEMRGLPASAGTVHNIFVLGGGGGGREEYGHLAARPPPSPAINNYHHPIATLTHTVHMLLLTLFKLPVL